MIGMARRTIRSKAWDSACGCTSLLLASAKTRRGSSTPVARLRRGRCRRVPAASFSPDHGVESFVDDGVGAAATRQLGGSVLVTSVAGCHPGRELGTILHPELPQDVRDMSLDRLARQEQRARDVRVAGATRDEIRDLPLAVAQDREV